MFPFNFQLSDDFCEVFGRKSRIGFFRCYEQRPLPVFIQALERGIDYKI